MKKIEKTDGVALICADIDREASIAPYDYLSPEKAAYVGRFHRSLPFYAPTPLVALDDLSKKVGLGGIYVKDESKRFAEFGLNAFKGLGGIFAVGQVICRQLGLDPENTTFGQLTSPEIREKTKDMVFATTTDGNHGRGVAWAAHQYGCRSYVFMPKGSAPARVAAIKRVGAEECTVTDMNYDDTVAYTEKLAKEKGWHLVQDTAWEGYEEIPQLIVQGYTTLGQEALDQLARYSKKPTHVFLQAGVGSLAGSIIGYYAHILGRDVKFAIVEPTRVACFYHSAEINDRQPHGVESTDGATIMAGLNCGKPSIGVWPVIRDLAGYYIACDDDVTEEGMRRLAYPVGNDTPIVSGESAGVGTGLVERIMTDEKLSGVRDALGLDQNSIVLLFSTEGNTDPDGYARVVGKK